jgi:ADP-ribose pyrophosphatase YjhB (NUDIX family)
MKSYSLDIREKVGPDCRIFSPGVRAVILNSDNEVLLLLMKDWKQWGLPAGGVEIGETALEALKREVFEETSLEIIHAEPMGLYSGSSQQFEYPNGDKMQGFAVAFIVREWTGTPKVDGIEGVELRFWSLDKLPHNIIKRHAGLLNDFKKYNGKFQLYG